MKTYERRNSNKQLRGSNKIWGTEHRREHEQAQEPKLNMGGPEDTTSGTNTNIQNTNSTNTDNNKSNS